MIKAIIFDMVGPLLQKDPNYQKNELVEEVESLASMYKDTNQLENELKINARTKEFSEEEIAKRAVKKYIKIYQIWNELLPALKKQGFKLAVVNNGTSLTIPFFKKENKFEEFFSIFINSSEEGIEKPNPEIYILACKKLGVEPEECIFIDDLEENVLGAKKVGMIGFVYKDYQSLIHDLSSYVTL